MPAIVSFSQFHQSSSSPLLSHTGPFALSLLLVPIPDFKLLRAQLKVRLGPLATVLVPEQMEGQRPGMFGYLTRLKVTFERGLAVRDYYANTYTLALDNLNKNVNLYIYIYITSRL